MTITLHHNPQTRAANVVWMLEEVGVPHVLKYVDIRAGEQHGDEHLKRNRMGKVPVLEDGEVVVSETAAIGVYLADRYAPGRLAPALDDARRGAYLRWCFYAPSVVEPACAARAAGWTWKPGQMGWGSYERVVETLDEGLARGPWLLGDTFTMADVIIGSALRWMLLFKMIDALPSLTAYTARLAERPALKTSVARNAAISAERGLNR
jgi:glutathione S-transferase